MRIWLLSHLSDSPGNRLVMEAGQKAGHEMRLVQPERLSLTLSPTLAIHDDDAALELPELVFTRMGSSATPAAVDALLQLEALGVRCVNSNAALAIARDKARTFQVLTLAGVPVPPTVLVGGKAALEPALAHLGPPPWIVKLPVSTQGLGVARLDSAQSLSSVLGVLRGLGQRVLVQRWVEEAEGTDLRVLVMGGKAVAGMRRRAAPGGILSNLHQGGSAEGVALTDAMIQVAESAARALGLEVAGVDLLPSSRGPVVCEVNGSPGLEGLQRATERDLAGELLVFLAQGLPGTPPDAT